MRALVYCGGAVLFAATLAAQQPPRGAPGSCPAVGGLTVAQIEKPSTDSWPTYNGDYSGRRFSSLTKINAGNVKNLSLAWIYDLPAAGTIKATPLQIGGVLYFTTPNHVYADRRANRARAVALHLQQEPRRHPDWQSRRRGTRQHRLLRHDRLQPGRARHQDRDGKVGEGVLFARDDVLRVDGPGRRQGQADSRTERRRPRRARLPRSPEPGERRSDLALVRHAAERGRPRPRHVAEPRHGQARRRHDLAARSPTTPS